MAAIEQHFVTFLSPGTFVDEETTKPMDEWDVNVARTLAAQITERYDARPFGFYFTTRRREDDDLDSRQVARSGIYYLGGNILTLDEVMARNRAEDSILISNMRGNGIERVIENTNSWKITKPFNDGDVLLEQ
jgi:hypothetical protein